MTLTGEPYPLYQLTNRNQLKKECQVTKNTTDNKKTKYTTDKTKQNK